MLMLYIIKQYLENRDKTWIQLRIITGRFEIIDVEVSNGNWTNLAPVNRKGIICICILKCYGLIMGRRGGRMSMVMFAS